MSVAQDMSLARIPVVKKKPEGPLYQNELIHLCYLQIENGGLYKVQMDIQQCQEVVDSPSRMLWIGYPL